MKTESLIALTILASNLASASNLLVNSSFESPSYGSSGIYYEYNPTGAAWDFKPPTALGGSGITVLPSLWSYAFLAPEGKQVAFIQGPGMSISQDVTFLGSSVYTLSFSDAGRENVSGNLTYDVRMGGISLGRFRTVTGQPFSRHSIDFMADSGLQTLEFIITATENNKIDNSVFIDDVRLFSTGPVLPDSEPPAITITSPLSNRSTSFPPITLIGSIFDQSGITNASWSLNGQDFNNLFLTNGQFNVQIFELATGTNTITIVASDSVGNRAKVSTSVIVPALDPSALLVNIDFTDRLNPDFKVKEGPAAAGHVDNDFWNIYSRDVNSRFGPQYSGVVTNLRTAERKFTGIDLSVDNVEGARSINSADAMMGSYLYSGTGNISVQMTKIPAGNYDLYVYAHGQLDNQNAVIDLTADNAQISERATSSRAGWNSAGWQNGNEFVVFRSVSIASNGIIDLAVKGGISGLAVINGLQLIMPAATNVDLHPPVVTITSPLAGNTNAKTIDLAGSATDDVGVVNVTWFLNDGAINSLALTNGTFMIPTIVLRSGNNVIRVIAVDAEGNQGTSSVELIYTPPIFLTIGDSTVQEGADLTVPIFLSTAGDVSGLSFSINYDPNLLANPRVEWLSDLANALISLNTNSSGQLHASLALPGQVLATGGSILANLTFQTRSVAADRSSTLTPSLSGLFDSSGSVITSDSGTHVGTIQITRRRFLGDNNGNNRLDVGDASALMRFVTGFDPIQNWDISGNDLNSNGIIDSGDVIKVLRAVVGLDLQPQGTNGALSHLRAEQAVSASTFTLTVNETTIRPGDAVNVRVELSNNEFSLTGASFRLAYPTNALRLIDAQSLQSGSLVPGAAAVLWNVSPQQNNFAAQDGIVSAAMSSALSWSASNGTIAEFAFQVQPEASSQLTWPITISNGEVGTGFQVQPVSNAQILLQGRAPIPLAFAKINSTSVQLRVEGEVGKTYEVDYSNDLEQWTPLSGGLIILSSSSASVVDANNAGASYRFYRVSEITGR